MLKKSTLGAVALLLSPFALAAGQYLVTDAQITRVGNTSGNGDSFWVVATGGNGPCVTTSTQNNIYFPKTAAGNEKIFDRAYAAALAALASGKKVNIYNYADGTCNSAVAIELMSY